MRRFLIALMILSILSMARSVVSVTQSQSDSIGVSAATASTGLVGQQQVAAIGGMPDPLALLMLLSGLSGLAAAGGRPSGSRANAEL